MTPLDLFEIFRNTTTTISIVCAVIFCAMYSSLQASLSTHLLRSVRSLWTHNGVVVPAFWHRYDIRLGMDRWVDDHFFQLPFLEMLTRTGMLMDREYANMAKRLGLDPDERRQHDLADFPIGRVRLSLSKYAVVLCMPCIIGYGWALQYHAVCILISIRALFVNLWSAHAQHMAVPLVSPAVFIGFMNQVNSTAST